MEVRKTRKEMKLEKELKDLRREVEKLKRQLAEIIKLLTKE